MVLKPSPPSVMANLPFGYTKPYEHRFKYLREWVQKAHQDRLENPKLDIALKNNSWVSSCLNSVSVVDRPRRAQLRIESGHIAAFSLVLSGGVADQPPMPWMPRRSIMHDLAPSCDLDVTKKVREKLTVENIEFWDLPQFARWRWVVASPTEIRVALEEIYFPSSKKAWKSRMQNQAIKLTAVGLPLGCKLYLHFAYINSNTRSTWPWEILENIWLHNSSGW
jgi:hypothetical protein